VLNIFFIRYRIFFITTYKFHVQHVHGYFIVLHILSYTILNHANACSGIIPPSPEEHPILGLNLLRLLVQNRIAEFHTELELLPAKALENLCIKHAVELEQSFMEGAYNRVLTARQAVPHETYVYFMDLLAKTVRDEIAGCSEKGYDYLSISDAKQMIMFSSDQELQQYIAEEHPEWDVKNGSVFFQKAKESQPCKEIPAAPVITQTLGYARELERIV
jgi:26S proteasome regulatory subunit N12